MILTKQLTAARSRHLVFSSVGNHSNLRCWLKGGRGFDLWITYYGDQSGRGRAEADYYNERHGSKFQNLHFAYQHCRDIFDRYQAVMVLDDDVVISGSAISRLFEYRERYDLWALQPAFSPLGKISWPITRVDRRNTLRYTNFVEMTCPLFRKDKLDAFMAVYDPTLVGWGCDWWFLETMGDDLCGRVAVVDAIPCVNPHDSMKGTREIDRLQPAQERKDSWETIKVRYGVRNEQRRFEQYGVIRRDLLARLWAQSKGAGVAMWLSGERVRRAGGAAWRGLTGIFSSKPYTG